MKKLLVAASLFALPAMAQTAAPTAPTTAAPQVPYNVDFTALKEGRPIDSRSIEKAGDQPLFPQQTRAPYHKTSPYTTTVLASTLHAPWALAVLPDNKLLVGCGAAFASSTSHRPPVTLGIVLQEPQWPLPGCRHLCPAR